MDVPTLKKHLAGVTTIPILPFKADGSLDDEGHAANIRYLLDNNRLEGGLQRVISIAGTSLIHQVDFAEQTALMDRTARLIGDRGVFISGIVPHMPAAERLVGEQLALERPPDAFLMMPLDGVYNPTGMADTFLRFADKHGKNGGRFLLYFRNARDRSAVIQLMNRSEHFIGVKIGTGVEDVLPMVEGLPDDKLVVWGIGELNTTAATKLGARGHTSGTAVLAAGLADALNNAQRRGDFKEALRLENVVRGLEDIRFRVGRMYNYSAVVEAMNQSGFRDICGGAGHPLCPRVPEEVAAEVHKAIQPLLEFHA